MKLSRQLLSILPENLRQINSLDQFKESVRKWDCIDCPSRLCKGWYTYDVHGDGGGIASVLDVQSFFLLKKIGSAPWPNIILSQALHPFFYNNNFIRTKAFILAKN